MIFQLNFIHSRWTLLLITLSTTVVSACTEENPGNAASTSSSSSGGSGGDAGGNGGMPGTGGMGGAGGAVEPGPKVDSTNPKLYEAKFSADTADPNATAVLNTQLAYLDTTVSSRGVLVVFLHGAGKPGTCGSMEHTKMLARLGFHVMSPCYVSDYGVGNCGDDIEGCRLEAFEGVDHHPIIDIQPPDSIETRVVKGLEYLQTQIPQGDWTYFLESGKPKWSKIIISGISHGASSSAVIGLHRSVHGVVSLSGPLDSGQAWLKKPPLTPRDRFYAFSHTADPQHAGHLQSFEDMGLAGMPVSVDSSVAPYEKSHRLITSAATMDGHGSTQAGNVSPKDANGAYVFLPVWQTMYLSQ
jgi:hypothetical protein